MVVIDGDDQFFLHLLLRIVVFFLELIVCHLKGAAELFHLPEGGDACHLVDLWREHGNVWFDIVWAPGLEVRSISIKELVNTAELGGELTLHLFAVGLLERGVVVRDDLCELSLVLDLQLFQVWVEQLVVDDGVEGAISTENSLKATYKEKSA